ncbi:MAG: cupin [Pseudonocardiales bacterium]|nr:MAG: cupin [Pseudonocardiales bacterium]
MTLLADRGKAALHARPFPDLSRLIYPIDLATFRRDYWERAPLVVHRGDPHYFEDVLTLDNLDQQLSLSGTRLDSLRVVMNGKETPVGELGSSSGRNGSINVLEALYECYRNGSTIVLNSLEQSCVPLQRLAESLGAQLSARLQMNVYLTPAGAQGFAAHYDMHDVFIAQVYGTKHWRLASQPCELPLQGQPYDKSQPEPTPEQEFDLRAGDLLYLPRGAIHSATSNETASVHVTIGVHPVLYSQAITDALTKVFADDVRFRRGLPMGFATDENLQRRAVETVAELIGALQARMSPQDVVGESVKRAASISAPTLRHHLTDLEQLSQIRVHTPVRRRPDLRCHVTVAEDVVGLDFHNKTVQFPAHVADEVRFVAASNGAGFTGAAIPGELDEPGRVVLVQTLLREGFLTFG